MGVLVYLDLSIVSQLNHKFYPVSNLRSILLEPVQLSSAQLTAFLRIAHKYCMQSIEDQIIAKFKAADSTAGYVDLMVAAQITGSQALHQQALQGLRASDRKPDLEEAKKIGIEAYHELMQAPIAPGSRWVHCSSHLESGSYCGLAGPGACRPILWEHCAPHVSPTVWGCTSCHPQTR
jgi:hypothetical protein